MEKTKENKETKEAAKRWIEEGKPCVYRYGWRWKGAGARRLDREKALGLLPKYSFGMGFYELSYTTIDGVEYLEFNELGENDMW